MLFIPGTDSVWLNDNDAQGRLAQIEEIEQKLRDAGIGNSGASRLATYGRAVRAMATRDESKLPSPRLALNLMMEIRELSLILQQMPRSPEIFGWQAKMRTALKGNVLSADDGADSAGRDAQFELYLASAFRAAGYEIALDEPDVTFVMDGQKFSIAAKRIKSDEAAERHIRKASKQISRSGYPGIIAVEITYPHDYTKPLLTNHMDGVNQTATRIADDFAFDITKRIRTENWLHDDQTFCLMVCLNVRMTVLESLTESLGMPIVAPKPTVGFRWTMMGLPTGSPYVVMARVNSIKDNLSKVRF